MCSWKVCIDNTVTEVHSEPQTNLRLLQLIRKEQAFIWQYDV